MIQELTIRQYALIDQVTVSFAPGLNILTGETGAGKSILIGAFGLLLGSKADVEVIRTGADEARVAANLTIEISEELREWLAENQISLSDDESTLLQRVVRPQKRGSSSISGQPVTRVQLEQFTSFLVDLHGQHEHQTLFSSDQHRRLLDRFAGLGDDLNAFSIEFQRLTAAKKKLEDLRAAEANRESELAAAEQTIAELERLRWDDPEEEEILKRQRTQMEQFEKLNGWLATVEENLHEGREAALGQLKAALGALSNIARLDDQWTGNERRLSEAILELEDLADEVHRYHRELAFEPDQLEQTHERLAAIHSAQKKYGVGWEAVQSALTSAKLRGEQLQGLESATAALAAEVESLEKALISSAMRLSEKRQAAARRLESGVKAVLADLGMAGAQFSVGFGRRMGDSGSPICTPSGLDQIDFLLAANAGENLRPLRETASGGELSRVMLALKTLLSEVDNIPILIFDEIDTGIGGDVGLALGKYLKRLSSTKQVLCITHLASVASFADHHLKVEKMVEGGRTTTTVLPLDHDQRVREVARMLSGSAVTEASLEHARALVESHAAKGKNDVKSQ